MNDPGLEGPISDATDGVSRNLKHRVPHPGDTDAEDAEKQGPKAAFRYELAVDDEEEDVGFLQPKRWWLTSTAFPLIAGSFGPLANLLSICALVQSWRTLDDGSGTRIPDPEWVLALNGFSLVLAIGANIFLLNNFAHRIRYAIAQPATILLWYLSATLLAVPLGIIGHLTVQPTNSHAFSQSYFYGLISAIIYYLISSLLLLNYVGAHTFHAYPPSFNALTIPQRTLMLQTISFCFYVALGAGVFSSIEGWAFVDGVYWADYTLLTIGFGTDFPLTHTLSRALLMPYTIFGITLVGLVVGSVRSLVLDRGKVKVMRRALGKEREKWIEKVKERRLGIDVDKDSQKWDDWHKAEFDVMRDMEAKAEWTRRYASLANSLTAVLFVWLGGALIFWACEKKASWTYFSSLYFTYIALLTIGYGDFYPTTNAGKPFFVIWSLVAVPTMTVFLSNAGDTVVRWVKEGTMVVAQRTILPERKSKHKGGKKAKESESAARTARETADTSSRVKDGDQIGEDVGRLGEAIGEAEEKKGRGTGLTARLAKEIQAVAKDVGKKPPVKYEWQQWRGWLELLKEESPGKHGAISKERSGGNRPASEKGNEDVELSWLADDGPLFSVESETEWLLARLCSRLEKALEEEIDTE